MLSLQSRDLRTPFSSFYQAPPPFLSTLKQLKPAACPNVFGYYNPKSIGYSRRLGGDYLNMGKGTQGDFTNYFAKSPGGRQASPQAKASSSKARTSSSSSSRSGSSADSSKKPKSSSSIKDALTAKTNAKSPRHAIAAAPLVHKSTKYDDYEPDSDGDDASSSSSGSGGLDSPGSYASSNSSLTSIPGHVLRERILEQRRQELVDEVMVRFYAFFSPWLEANFGIEATAAARRGNTKRPRRDSGTHRRGPRFACPFFKHDQKRYGKVRTCCGPGWDADDIHRLKEHLERKHSPPEYMCNRCLVDFKKEEALAKHQRSKVACQTRERKHGDVHLTREQMKKLKARFGAGLTARQKWERIYAIVFPGAEIPKDPYYAGGLTPVQQFGEFIRSELPSAIRRNAEADKSLQEFERIFLDNFTTYLSKAISVVSKQFQELQQQQQPEETPAIKARSMASSRCPPSPSTESSGSLPSPGALHSSLPEDFPDFSAATAAADGPISQSLMSVQQPVDPSIGPLFDQLLSGYSAGGFPDGQFQAYAAWDPSGASFPSYP
ncbi:hypothetical protein MAPG_04642 [Magnaporthiopsis poae ATCC 64411]|uniref:C2H2-type domain-containing protein n=1 Tax=Magnaporthiopsis poae (strain ATCC 64411 / 73-15) TaxID=644358 RepID=A0A0C4DXA1_MAGP6|nr:hypothetical protein MAPG_04642 [Magnaporthiopsis poae ATCC 64411]